MLLCKLHKKSKHMSLGKETVCVEMEMRRCQGNSLFLSPTTQKLHNSIEKALKDTQTLYKTKSLREARKNIIVLVDHSTTWFSLRESNCGWVCQYYEKRNAEHKRTFQHKNDVNSAIKDRPRQWIVLSIIKKKQKVIDKRFKGYGG